MTGNWTVNVSNGLPQKVASAIGELGEKLLGAEYTPILYLGSQVVNGINHAVLAEQLITSGRDTKNVVILIFNEKPGDMKATLVGIERVVESGGELGGTAISVTTDITGETKKVWDNAFEGFVGSKVTPVAYLGAQVVNGTNFIFLAEAEPVYLNAEKKLVLVTINGSLLNVSFVDILGSRHESSLGYSFTW